MKTIPIIFACDNNYVGPLSVTISSLMHNASKNYKYRLIVLTDNLNNNNRQLLTSMVYDNYTIEFNDVSKYFDGLKERLSLRDYYTLSTYFRFLIPDLYKEYNKAIYLDSDLVITGDISKLYNVTLTHNLVAAVTEDFVVKTYETSLYVERVLNISRYNYFNAGILLMNLRLFRQENILSQFVSLSKIRRFIVAQDQDYLNVLCKDRVVYLDHGWNKCAEKDDAFDDKNLKIIHCKLLYKPWHYSGIHYEDIFWYYAKLTPFYKQLLRERDNYPQYAKEKDEMCSINLLNQCIKDVNDMEKGLEITDGEYRYKKA